MRFGRLGPFGGVSWIKKESLDLLIKEGVSADHLRPMNIMHCMWGVAASSGFENVGTRYNSLCDYVHHNLSSGTVVNAGSLVSKAARSSVGGMLVMPKPGPITRYEYPIPVKWKYAVEQTDGSFISDVRACANWINSLPESPYSSQEILSPTGSTFGVEQIQSPVRTHFRKPTAFRNEPCPCGSGKKYKKCFTSVH